MNKDWSFLFVIVFIFWLALAFGCTTQQMQIAPEDFESSCIQGKISYRSPIDSTLAPYPGATVNAWRADTDKGLAETRTDKAGNYCIEVPRGEYRIELRVWGALRLEGTTYLCQGTEANIGLGTTSKKCGEDCQEINITSACKERVPGPRR